MPTGDSAVIVAANDAWPEYQEHHAYVCQPDRPFRRESAYLGFYYGGAIQPLVPRIERWIPSVPFTRTEAHALRHRRDIRVGDLVDRLLDVGPRIEATSYGVMLLSAPEDPATLRLDAPICNDSVAASGRRTAWTRWQRYVPLDKLLSGVTFTSELR
jgi:hypothetical protein